MYNVCFKCQLAFRIIIDYDLALPQTSFNFIVFVFYKPMLNNDLFPISPRISFDNVFIAKHSFIFLKHSLLENFHKHELCQSLFNFWISGLKCGEIIAIFIVFGKRWVSVRIKGFYNLFKCRVLNEYCLAIWVEI